MFPRTDISTVQFGEPVYLWLLVVPAVLLLVWVRQLQVRRADARHFRQHREVPVRERFAPFGNLLGWLCILLAVTLTILAMARPKAAINRVRTTGVDLVILQDGSASMHVRDVRPDRWQRSTSFLRVLAQSLHWTNDRIALALFAHIAAPQVRLTRDVNTFFFFLDHLDRESPFPLQDDTTWDTNIEVGIYWGVRLIEKDEELHGPNANSKAFVLLSDGQAWSGEIERSLKLARTWDIPVFVVGVGTPSGGYIPEAPDLLELRRGTAPVRLSSVHSTLDRASLLAIASAGGGQYFDLNRDGDRAVATAIIDATRRRGRSREVEESFDDLYWECLFAAACLLCLSVLWLRGRSELLLHAIGTGAALLMVWAVIR